MIGRAAVKEPWIFAQIKEGMKEPSSELIKSVVLEHFDQMVAYYDKYGAIMFRKNLHSYSKAGFQGASAFRDTINRMEDPKEMRDVIEQFFSQKFLREEA
jgi:tRNA-dihydrouridine synthase B